MKDILAERLLGIVLGWTPEELSNERPIIDALASLKYDDYQQFKPGLKFLESLALWLYQFEPNERKIAYDFIKTRLIYISSSEINHLVDISYPAIIKPILFEQVSKIPYWQTERIAESQLFKELRRRSLFLGLSDGARIDRFRRTNNELSHEQIYTSYELSIQKVESLVKKLKEDLQTLRGTNISDDDATFKNIFLLDDFSASGMSMLRKKDDGKYGGKLEKIYHSIFSIGAPLINAIDRNGCNIYSILYLMTDHAEKYLNQQILQFWDRDNFPCRVKSVLQLENKVKVNQNTEKQIMKLICKYYDPDTFDEHMEVGGTADGKLGFAGCALPVVISHNTPNDSIFLLWSNSANIRGLFPRVARHKEEI